MQNTSDKKLIFATIATVAVIIFGSLYNRPFVLQNWGSGANPVLFLLSTWKEPPSGRGDLVANILLYMPYGFFAALAFPHQVAARKRLLWVTLGGFVLCTVMELCQFYDQGRVTNMSDVYLNSLGSFIGAMGGVLLGADFRWPLLREIALKPFPSLLLAAWFGYRLYPYVPTIDLHKYWRAIRPIVVTPTLPLFDLFHYVVVWTVVAYIVQSLYGARRFAPIFALAVAVEFVGKIFIIDNQLKLTDLVGAGLAFALWLAIRSSSRRRGVLAAALGVLIVALRLEPFQFSAASHGFGWIPFLSFMRGSLEVDIISFLEKFFLYGGLIWLLVESGWSLAVAAFWVALMLLITSFAEIYLPGRSAEMTDATLVLAAAVIYRLLPHRHDPVPQLAIASGFSSRLSRGTPAPSIPAKARPAPP